jgi:putative membrane protein
MITNFSKNPIKSLYGVFFWNRRWIFFFLGISTLSYILYHVLDIYWVKLPIVPVSILGGAIAIFLGFRNSSAYDRWWEARKIWGAIVNDSRTLVMQILSYSTSAKEDHSDEAELKAWQKEMIYRHIGWVYALASHLRKEEYCKELQEWVKKEDQGKLQNKSNIPAQIVLIQGMRLKHALDKGWIENFRQFEMMGTLSKLYDDQGKSERIKNTVFPYYYNYFTSLFLRLFTLCLPFALVSHMDWAMIPICTAISFVFAILDKTGQITEVPFEGRAADTPLKTLCRGIEIDLREMINDDNIPAPLEDKEGKFGVVYKE